MKLVIVESPGKIKKIESILGDEYMVLASVGHIIDLEPTKLSSYIANKFEPTYIVKDDRKDVVAKLIAAHKKADEVFIATDEDREGEMIAWSVAFVLKIKNANRITFTSITKEEIKKAIANPRKIDHDLVLAQKARRMLDLIVGYELSPCLWRTVRANLSAGRVQSVVTRLIADKENEIELFFQKESSSNVKFTGCFLDINETKFTAQLFTSKKSKVAEIDDNEEENDNKDGFKKGTKPKISIEKARELLDAMTKSKYTIGEIEEKDSLRNPSPPFTTSTIQQEASRKLGFTIKKTMQVAQNLYEAGYITYMRTDSVCLSQESLNNIQKYIVDNYTKKYFRQVKYTSKSQNTQEAHEAIRPSDIFTVNVEIKNKIQADESRLYKLIWKRTVASQMTPAKFKIKCIQININKLKEYFYMTQVQTLVFDGFLKVYNIEKVDKDNEDNNEDDKSIDLPDNGELINIHSISASEEYQKPPTRYNEASLVKKIDPENMNIGRPSTYGSIINTIQERQYVEKKDVDGIEKKSIVLNWINGKQQKITETTKKVILGKDLDKLVPTATGILVTNYLVKNFPEVLDYKFTSLMEDKLDLIAENKSVWNEVLDEFYKKFHPQIEKVLKEKATVIDQNSKIIGQHPDTGADVIATIGKFGPMVKMAITKTKFAYAPIKSPLKIDTIKLSDVLKLFEYPKILGKHEKKPVLLNKGKFGLYITYDELKISVGSKKPTDSDTIDKEVDSDEDNDNNEEITLKKAIELIKNKKKDILWEKKDGKIHYIIKSGEFGQYISVKDTTKATKKPMFVSVPKNTVITELTLDKVKEIIKKKPKKKFVKKVNSKDKIKD